MTTQFGFAWLMIVTQAVLFFFLGESIVLPVLAVAISLPSVLWRERQWEISPKVVPLIDLVAISICMLSWYLAPHELKQTTGFVMYPMVFAAAQFFLLAQVIRIWSRRHGHVLPVYLPLLAVLVFICLGDLDVYRWQRRLYQNATISLVILICLFYSQSRRIPISSPRSSAKWLRPVLSIGILLMTSVTARSGSVWLRSHWRDIETLMQRFTGPPRRHHREDLLAGFSGTSTLESIRLLKKGANNEIALRVISDEAPGYLRGAVFENFNGRAWEWQFDWQPIAHTRAALRIDQRKSLPFSIPASSDSHLFAIRDLTRMKNSQMTIWRETIVDRFTFLPLNAALMEVDVNTLVIDRHGGVSADQLPPAMPLRVWAADSIGESAVEPIIQPADWNHGQPFQVDDSLYETVRQRLIKRSDRIHPRVAELAAELFADCETDEQKIQAVTDYLKPFQYSTEIVVPPQTDPLAYFLFEQRAAHCEYFATATAILLRLGDVPCRYVTGFAGADFSSLGKYWIVRQQDAHAWVEAYLPRRGWTIVETTPPSGAPRTSDEFKTWHLWDEINLRGQMIRAALAAQSLAGTWTAIKLFATTLVTTIPGWLLSSCVLFLLSRQIRWPTQWSRKPKTAPAQADLQRLFSELESRLKRLRIERAAYETLHQFANRLRAESSIRPTFAIAADWIERYAKTRYSTDNPNGELHALNTDLKSVCQQLA